MTRSLHTLRGRGPALIVACAMVALFGVEPAVAVNGTGNGPEQRQAALHWQRALAHLLAGGSSLPPPPAALQPYLRHFVHLYVGYQALAADDKPPFAMWLVMNGVTDPTTHRAMLALHHWVETAIARDGA